MCADTNGNNNDELNQQTSDNEQDELGAKLFNSIPVTVSVVLGKSTMPIIDVVKLRRGAVINLNRKVGEMVDLYISGELIARGEPVILDNSVVGVRLTEIITKS